MRAFTFKRVLVVLFVMHFDCFSTANGAHSVGHAHGRFSDFLPKVAVEIVSIARETHVA